MNTMPQRTGLSKYAWCEIPRVDPPSRPPAHRISDFEEVEAPYTEITASEQASRCIQCPNPPCVEACPLNVPIPELLALTADGRFMEAAEKFVAHHNLPEVFTQVCSGTRLCEAACLLAAKSDPLPIGAIARFLLNYSREHEISEPPPAPANGRRVCVVGAGICGLVSANILSTRGYGVTVLDCHDRPGGYVMTGLPGFRADKTLIAQRIEKLKRRGVLFRMGVICGRDATLDSLRRDFDAIFFGLGHAGPVALDIPGATLKGVGQAYFFVSQNSSDPSVASSPVEVRGRRVAVLGGGDTAMDALRVAIRAGAREAVCICRRDSANIAANPAEFRHAQEEGARFLFLTQPVALAGNAEGGVCGVHCVRMEPSEPDANGRPSVKPVPNSAFDVPADVVLVAYGFKTPELPQDGSFGDIRVDHQNRILVDADQMTSVPGVFAGGSLVRGPAPLAEIVRDARKAALAMDRYLSTRSIG